jgi:hypothetical protein
LKINHLATLLWMKSFFVWLENKKGAVFPSEET